jgi:hypothetical protein
MRARFGSLLEWVVAAACILAALAIGSVLVREFRTVSAVAPVIAHEETQPEISAAIPPGSVAVPVVLLPNGAELHVGDTATDLAARVGTNSDVARPGIERTGSGERVTRFYEIDGRRFVVVLGPQVGDEQVRIVALFTIPQT